MADHCYPMKVLFWKYLLLNLLFFQKKVGGGGGLPLHGPCALADRNKGVFPFLFSELPTVIFIHLVPLHNNY